MSDSNILRKSAKTLVAGIVPLVLLTWLAPPMIGRSVHAVSKQQPEGIVPSREMKQLMELNLQLVEAYPDKEWTLTGLTTPTIYPLSGTTLSEKFMKGREYRLTTMISNGNDAALVDPEMVVSFPSDIAVKRPTSWRPLDASPSLTAWQASGFIRQIPGKTIKGIDESLFLTFPRADVYRVRYEIRGLADKISLKRQGTFLLRLVTP